MIERTIHAADRGQRLDKYLKRTLPNAGASFVYKMLRKKNITRNHQKADGSELLTEGDLITFFLSDETFAKFAGENDLAHDRESDRQCYIDAYHELSRRYPDIRILYEQSDLLFVQKPAGVLSQKAKDSDMSLNEWLLGYLLEQHVLSISQKWTYTPSVCNRLDRNTGGIVICAKTLLGSHAASQILRDRSVHKFYRMVVVGSLQGSGTIKCWTVKDSGTNAVTVYDHEVPGASATRTEFRSLRYSAAQDLSLVEAELVTGKTHQLRVHLKHIGHPILGDPKYGDRSRNHAVAARGVHCQLLWAVRLELPVFCEPELADLSGRTIQCEPPGIFEKVMH